MDKEAQILKETCDELRAEKKQLHAALKALFLAATHKGIPKFGSMVSIYEQVTDALKIGQDEA
jgi:hypothetical protein